MAAAVTRLVFSLMCLSQATADSCLQSLPEYSDQWNGNNPASHFMGKTQAIIPAYSFNCSGNITWWGAYVEAGGSSKEYLFDFQVWRPSRFEGCYARVGSNRLEQILPKNNQIILEVPEEDQIQVQPGDVVGFYTKCLLDGSGGIQLSVSMAADSRPVWYAGEITSTSTGECRLSVGENRTLNSMIIRKPIVTAVVGRKLETPTPTLLSSSTTSAGKSVTIPADPIQPPEDNPEDNMTSATFLVLGVIIGCIVTIIIIVVAIGIYVIRRKRASEVEDDLQGHANDLPAIDNISYAPQKIFPGQNGGLMIPTARNAAYGAVPFATETRTYDYPQPVPSNWPRPRALSYEVPVPTAKRVVLAVKEDRDLSDNHYELCELGDKIVEMCPK